jgi:V/A-type H+-transporting ATPase subunit C
MGLNEAMKYAYSTGRIKAMEAKLVSKQAMESIINAKDGSTMLSLLFETGYREEITEYGGVAITAEHIDFALSKNLAKDVSKLYAISPNEDKDLIRAIMGKWDLYNIKLALEAKDRQLGYDAIAMYLIDYGRYDAAAVKDVMREPTAEGMLNRFMINSPYRTILSLAYEIYLRGKNMNETIAAIDKGYYDSLNKTIMKLDYVHKPTARVMRTEIEMVNALTLIRAKKLGLKFQEIQNDLVWSPGADGRGLQQMYDSAPNVEAIVAQIKAFDLRNALEVYRRNGQLLSFEIGMRNGIFDASMRLLRHAMLSFGTIVAYMYMKEIEVYTLRISINSAYYGLSKEDLSRLMIWKA